MNKKTIFQFHETEQNLSQMCKRSHKISAKNIKMKTLCMNNMSGIKPFILYATHKVEAIFLPVNSKASHTFKTKRSQKKFLLMCTAVKVPLHVGTGSCSSTNFVFSKICTRANFVYYFAPEKLVMFLRVAAP